MSKQERAEALIARLSAIAAEHRDCTARESEVVVDIEAIYKLSGRTAARFQAARAVLEIFGGATEEQVGEQLLRRGIDSVLEDLAPYLPAPQKDGVF